MRICEDNWAALREKIDAAGLGKFVVKSGEAAAEKMVTPDAYEPLLGAHNAIVSNCLGVAGLSVMQKNDDGTERCPLCFLIKECPHCRTDEERAACRFLTWLDRAVEDQVAEARRRGLIPEPS